MAHTNVKSGWLNGNLVFYDKSDNVIFTIDGHNRKLTFPSGSEFELSSGATADIADILLQAADLALAQGSVLVGNSSGAAAALSAKTSGQILVGNGTTVASVAVSGDGALSSAGALTISDLTIASEAQGDILVRGASSWARLAAKTSGYILVGDGTTVASVAVSGDATLSSAGVLSFANDSVDIAHLGTDTNTWLNAIRSYVADGMLAIGTLAISATPEEFKTTTTALYRVAGVHYSKAATDNLTFSGTSTINTAGAAGTNHWGVFLVQINAAGTVSTKNGTFTSGTDQDYASEALAIAALPAADAGNVQIGYITIQGKASTAWIEATSDMTAGSDCETSTFYDLPTPATLPAALT